MTGPLATIIAATETHIEGLRRRRREIEASAAAAPDPAGWRGVFHGPHVSVVAEVKRRSPSTGAIAPGLDPAHHARAYASGGAAAISVLTEETHFGGSLADLGAVRCAVSLPVLRKDFILDPIQLYESRASGASAVLLIVRVLESNQLRALVNLSRDLGMGSLVEVHDSDELDRALAVDPDVVGVNSRDLDTFTVDVNRLASMLPTIPNHIAAIAESGLRSRDDVERVASWGADGVLVGTELAASADPEAAARALTGVVRVGRN